jgi:hypothetical protein
MDGILKPGIPNKREIPLLEVENNNLVNEDKRGK